MNLPVKQSDKLICIVTQQSNRQERLPVANLLNQLLISRLYLPGDVARFSIADLVSINLRYWHNLS